MRTKLLNFLLLITFVPVAIHGSVLNELDIHVVLSKNGDAHITEIRKMTIGSEGTECYIRICNAYGNQIDSLSVSDEQGLQFKNVSHWVVDESRDWKTGKCGIHQTDAGQYELCWGLGAEGERTYTTSYTVTNLVNAYTNSDGFNWMFVAHGLQPSPQHVRLTISAADGTQLCDSIANIWAFRYGGDVSFVDGTIVAETTEPFGEKSAMIVMVEFVKGVFSPATEKAFSFETVKQKAFEGSDYTFEEEDKEPWWEKWLKWIAGIGIALLALIGLVGDPVERFVKKRKYASHIEWYREIPMNGNLTLAYDLLIEMRAGIDQYDSLLSAYIVKLINMGALGIETRPDKNGKMVPAFVAKTWPADNQLQPDDLKIMQQIFGIFEMAAGDDRMLEPQELKAFMKDEQNESTLFEFVNTLHKVRLVYLSEHKDDVRNLLGLKKYLEDFTLVKERNVQEVTLWKDYMVYATLFGIASKVISEMQKINPEYFKMDSIARQMVESSIVSDMQKTFIKSTDDVRYRQDACAESSSSSSRSYGGGGRASRGGGGGYSGGGYGGGIR